MKKTVWIITLCIFIFTGCSSDTAVSPKIQEGTICFACETSTEIPTIEEHEEVIIESKDSVPESDGALDKASRSDIEEFPKEETELKPENEKEEQTEKTETDNSSKLTENKEPDNSIAPEAPPKNNNLTDDTLSITRDGKIITESAYDIVCHIVQNEVGGYKDPCYAEALKAQAVATYTYVKYQNTYKNNAPSMGYKATITENVSKAVGEVIGEAVYYNGKYALTTYFSMAAGCTTSASNYWIGGNYPYLVSVESIYDKNFSTGWSKYKQVKEIDLETVESKLCEATSLEISLEDIDPSNWFSDPTYTDGIYIDTVSIGDFKIKGRTIREALGLRSHAFEVVYNPDTKTFAFTTYGYGHGVGMSQVGAGYYSEAGWTYKEILTHYYSGTVVQ